VAIMRILVVEDEPQVAEYLAEAIRGAGYEAMVALDGTEALDVLAVTQVDGVFLDLVMPGLSGLAVLAQIRKRHPHLPVVIISGNAVEEIAAKADELGAIAVLAKPTALAEVRGILSRLRSAD
jgi:CheY-like chemotaxis protein